jgi:hypothetical protein
MEPTGSTASSGEAMSSLRAIVVEDTAYVSVLDLAVAVTRHADDLVHRDPLSAEGARAVVSCLLDLDLEVHRAGAL